jgi:hypothetical protein
MNQVTNSQDEVWWAFHIGLLREMRDKQPHNLAELISQV